MLCALRFKSSAPALERYTRASGAATVRAGRGFVRAGQGPPYALGALISGVEALSAGVGALRSEVQVFSVGVGAIHAGVGCGDGACGVWLR